MPFTPVPSVHACGDLAIISVVKNPRALSLCGDLQASPRQSVDVSHVAFWVYQVIDFSHAEFN